MYCHLSEIGLRFDSRGSTMYSKERLRDEPAEVASRGLLGAEGEGRAKIGVGIISIFPYVPLVVLL